LDAPADPANRIRPAKSTIMKYPRFIRIHRECPDPPIYIGTIEWVSDSGEGVHSCTPLVQ
jgi:hypothetical protein